MLGGKTLDTWACGLDEIAAGKVNSTEYPATTAFGLVGSPTVWAFNYTSGSPVLPYDRVVVASADGRVYALNWEVCALGSGGKRAVCNHTMDSVPIEPTGNGNGTRVSAGDDGLRAGLGGGPVCLQFVVQLPDNKPSYGPARFVLPNITVPGAVGTPISSVGMVLVTSTDATQDTGGALHALHGDTGQLLWSYQATAMVNGSSVSYGLRGVVPAVDDSRGWLLYLAYGPTVVALYPTNGTVAASITVPGGSDGFVASSVLSSDASALYLHSAAGTVWRVNITGGAVPKLTWAWACDYNPQSYAANASVCTVSSGDNDLFVPHPARVPQWSYDAVTGARAYFGDVTVPRSRFVGGGWPQLMTLEQRQALFDELHELAVGAPGYTSAVQEALLSTGGELAREALAAVHASLLSEGQLNSAGLGKAHARLDSTGRPAWLSQLPAAGTSSRRLGMPAGLDGATLRRRLMGRAVPQASPTALGAEYRSTYPYATPALGPSSSSLPSGYLIVPQFLAYGSGDTGLFGVDAGSGKAVWAFTGTGQGTEAAASSGNKVATRDGSAAPVSSALSASGTPFGRSRSSPALDATGGLYVGADVDWDGDGPAASLPTLYAFQTVNSKAGPGAGYVLQWATEMGQAQVMSVGSASPLVKLANGTTQNELVMAAGTGANGFREGKRCPTVEASLECSARGACDCFTGLCNCNSGWTGADCSTAVPKPGNDSNDQYSGVWVTGIAFGGLIGVGAALWIGNGMGVWAAVGKALGLKATAAAATGVPSSAAVGPGLSGPSYDIRPLMSAQHGPAGGTPGEQTSLLGHR